MAGARRSLSSVLCANLSGANLTGAKLSDSSLQGANLTGAVLTGASMASTNVNGVIWSATTCPDGTSSNKDGRSCRGHF
jgi:uncharacterized protein YjbI with pentapeptide repeats